MLELLKSQLKNWGLLKSKADWEYFYKIVKMSLFMKLHEDPRLNEDYSFLVKNSLGTHNPEKVKEYIIKIQNRKHQIMLADTYFTILNAFKTLAMGDN